MLTQVTVDAKPLNPNEADMLRKWKEAHPDTNKPQPDPKTGNTPTPTPKGEEAHKNKARPSTEEPHEDGKARKKRDKGGEKGDQTRRDKGMWPRKPPGGVNPPGGWPPKPKKTDPNPPKKVDPKPQGG